MRTLAHSLSSVTHYGEEEFCELKSKYLDWPDVVIRNTDLKVLAT